jgi:hypothetical protein
VRARSAAVTVTPSPGFGELRVMIIWFSCSG